MDFLEADKLILFILFVVPGFISLRIYDLMCPGLHRKSSDQLIDAVTYSSVNYAFFFGPVLLADSFNYSINSPLAWAAFYALALIVAPIFWPWLWLKLRKSGKLGKALPHPTFKPWDYIFGESKPYWIVVTMNNGEKIAGKFAGRSFASSSPCEEQLYLEETWVLNEDGGLERSRADTAGTLILNTQMASLEFFKLTYGEQDAGQQPSEQRPDQERLPAASD